MFFHLFFPFDSFKNISESENVDKAPLSLFPECLFMTTCFYLIFPSAYFMAIRNALFSLLI